MKKVIKIVEWITFVILIGLLFLMVSPYLPTKQYLASYAIVSGSMEPNVHIGAITFATQANAKDLHKGDIIAFTDPKNHKLIVLHRIYSIEETPVARMFITKGDHNKAPDNWLVTPAYLKGKFLFSIPYLGYITIFLKSPLGFGIIIGIPALLLIVFNLLKIKEGIKEEIEKGIIKKRKSSELPLNNMLMLFISSLVVTTIFINVPIIHGLAFNSVTLNGLSISTFSITITPTPTITPKLTPTPTPSCTPTPAMTLAPTVNPITPTPTFVPTPTLGSSNSCGGDTTITVSGNGAGSKNNVNVTNNCSTTITQTNNSSTTTIVNSTSNTGNNKEVGNTGGSNTITTGNSTSTIDITTQTDANSATVTNVQ